MFYRLCVQNPASGLLRIGHKLEKWQWRHNFLIWRHCQIFRRCSASLIKFSSWSKFHVNIITDSGVMTILFYKGLTRNNEIANTPVWVFPNIQRLGQVRDTKFGTNVSNTILRKGKVIKGKPRGEVKLPPTKIRVNLIFVVTTIS